MKNDKQLLRNYDIDNWDDVLEEMSKETKQDKQKRINKQIKTDMIKKANTVK